MSHVVLVGSGASGVHCALTALECGHDVTMLDVGLERPAPPLPGATFDELKASLPDPVRYFLGERGEGVVYPSTSPSYYGHPPSKQYVFDVPRGFDASSRTMRPYFSFAQGGLAEGWTGGVYAFNQHDLSPFPVSYEEMRRHYAVVSRRIGIGAIHDDLELFIPFDESYRSPLPLDRHSQWLWDRYHAGRERLQRSLGFHLGRSRVAVLSSAADDRMGCSQLGRCLWGCPNESIYSPRLTLRDCLGHPRFRYVPSVLVRHFAYDENGAVKRFVARRMADQETVEFEGDLFVLAAGALPSSKIMLDSVWRHSGTVGVLTGLMDNRQVHVPFLTPHFIGASAPTASYQFHHLAFGVTHPDPHDYVHGQITTLKSASVHPIVANLPLDLRGSLALFRALRAGLGVANVNLPDRRRPSSRVTLHTRPGADDDTELVIEYGSDPLERVKMAAAVRTVKRALRIMGCLVPPGMTRVLPPGTSAHYAGTMPMTITPGDFTCGADGRCHAFRNLFVADGAAFPFLPSKNHTFTLMANASRVAALLPR